MFAVAFALRLAAVLAIDGFDPAPVSPASDLDRVAWNLGQGAGFTLEDASGTGPTAVVAPVVPWLLGFVYRWFGHRPLPALVFQCLLGALVPILLGHLGASMLGASIGRTAGWLAAFSPPLVFGATSLHGGIALAVVLLASLAASASWVKTPRPGRALGVGMLLGLGALTHAAAAPLPLLIGVWAWTPLTLTVTPADRNRQLALLLLGLCVVAGPWVLRNVIAMESPVLTTSIGQRLLEGNNPAAWDDRARRGGGAVPPTTMAPDGAAPLAAARANGRDEVDRDARAARDAWGFARGRVSQWPAIAFAKAGRFWTAGALEPAPATGQPVARAIALLVQLWSLVLLPVAIYGFAGTLANPRRWFQALPAWVVLAFLIECLVFYASPVLRIPVEALALLFAAAGYEDVRRRVRARGRGLKVIEGTR